MPDLSSLGHPTFRRSAFGDAGYAMAALLTMLAVMAILMTAILPVWRHEMQREKEAELVFRGEQYVHAIDLYMRKFRANPPNIDILVQQKFLRKKYKDPITGKDFRPVYAGSTAFQRPGQGGGPGSGGPPTGGSGTQPPSQSRPGFGTQPQFQGGAASGGLIGVQSTSEEDSIRIYRGRTKYNQWQFIYAGLTTRPGAPGQPGRPGPGGRGPGQGPGGPRGPGMMMPPTEQRPPAGRPPGSARPPGDR